MLRSNVSRCGTVPVQLVTRIVCMTCESDTYIKCMPIEEQPYEDRLRFMPREVVVKDFDDPLFECRDCIMERWRRK